MATRAAIAAADRASREKIAEADRNFAKKKWSEQKKLEEYNAHTDRVAKTASAAGQLARGAGSLMVKGNDPEWYKRYGYDPFAAALPDFYRLGSLQFTSWRAKSNQHSIVPGICVFTYQDTLPNQNETNVVNSTYYQDSPINISLTRFMANLRKLNSRIGEYDPADLGMYWYAMRSLITVLGMLVKAINVYNTYYATNSYFAGILVEACGFDYNDFKDHIAEYKLLCQKYINYFNANAVIPTGLSFILRGIWLATCLVKDHDGDHAQIYTFRPYSFGHLNSDENTVVYSKITYPLTFNTVKNRLQLDVNNLFNSQGVITMMADLRAAYGDNVLQFNPDLNAGVTFSSSKHDLEQIHNLRTLYGTIEDDSGINVSDLENLNIFQDTDGYLKQGNSTSTIYIQTPADFNIGDCSICASRDYEYLDFYDEESCTPDMYLEATRLRMIQFSAKPGSINGYLLKYNGTEVVLYGVLYINKSGVADQYITEYFVTDLFIEKVGVDLGIYHYIISEYSTFDWLPIQRRFICSADYETVESWNDHGEIDHAITLPQQNLKWLHEVATLSEFYTDPIKPGRR